MIGIRFVFKFTVHQFTFFSAFHADNLHETFQIFCQELFQKAGFTFMKSNFGNDVGFSVSGPNIFRRRGVGVAFVDHTSRVFDLFQPLNV